MAIKTNGLRTETAQNLVLDAGAIYKNLEYDELTGEFTGTALGATSGGNEFTAELEIRESEIDGKKTGVKGLEFIDSHNAQLVVNLKEVTAENIKLGIGAADIDDTDENFQLITPRTVFKLDDYVENIAFVGRLSGSQRPVVIVIENALSMEGLSLTAEDNNEAIIPITFKGHLDSEEAGTDKAPYRIYYPKTQVA
ncbi:hypothetical protein [Salipaludibacillus sp. CF4.18]|uniref:hypothetical protein n=1 Tax=Salipaludibacillus sp. CF4.18 TaxID=3373081 RepID=UPI003EE4D349